MEYEPFSNKLSFRNTNWHSQLLFLLLMILILGSACNIFNNNSSEISTGIVGIVEYGEGDCMPSTDPHRSYELYSGELYFIVKSDLEDPGNGDFEQLKENSLKTTIKSGNLSFELPPDTFLVMPSDVYLYSDSNTVFIKKNLVLHENFKFWKCTSY